ncbi:MAG TPA: hypothetical protein PK529_15600 [Verrucomicrobiales bacterium]|nr:hypothetical protein [Verrucomicrobiales bacterium]
MMGSERLESLLKLLGGLMDAEGTPDLRLVVSGGAALIAERVIERSTADVDVFAQRELEGDIIPGNPLPGWFVDLVQRVAMIEELPRNWINADTSLVINGFEMLPKDCLRDLEEISFGSRLRISFLKRGSQIYLKAYAIIGRDEPRDSSDFRALQPTLEEITNAVDWMLERDLIGSNYVVLAKEKLTRVNDGQE